MGNVVVGRTTIRVSEVELPYVDILFDSGLLGPSGDGVTVNGNYVEYSPPSGSTPSAGDGASLTKDVIVPLEVGPGYPNSDVVDSFFKHIEFIVGMKYCSYAEGNIQGTPIIVMRSSTEFGSVFIISINPDGKWVVNIGGVGEPDVYEICDAENGSEGYFKFRYTYPNTIYDSPIIEIYKDESLLGRRDLPPPDDCDGRSLLMGLKVGVSYVWLTSPTGWNTPVIELWYARLRLYR